MEELDRKASIPDLRQHAKSCAAQGNIPLAASIRNAADELSFLRAEIVKLRGTIREIRSIANLSILRRI